MSAKIIRIGDIKTKKVDIMKEGDVYLGLAEPTNQGTVPMSVGVVKMNGGPVEVAHHWDEVTIISDGSMEVTVDGQKHNCTVGDMWITSKGTKLILNATPSCSCVFATLPRLEEAVKGTPLEEFFGKIL